MVHLTVTGTAKFVEDLTEKKRIWNGKVFDYDLSQFWPAGPESKDFGLMLITPDRVELTSLPEMMTGKKPEVWRAIAQVDTSRSHPRTRSRAKIARSSAVIFSRMRDPFPRCRYSPPSEKYSSYGCGGIGSGPASP